MNPFALYDDLIAAIPEDLLVRRALSANAACVESEAGVGVAAGLGSFDASALQGRPLREVAAMAKSWDFARASLGVAAMNSFYNRCANPGESIFTAARQELAGKKVVMVGHFSTAIPPLERICSLTVLERKPTGGDLPDSACEYVLPDAEVALITAMALTNKTLPRLLSLAKRAKTYVIGPSLPAAVAAFTGRASVLAPSAVIDPRWVIRQVEAGASVSKLKPGLNHFSLELTK
ncbi:Rossmann-like domain-containing protein [Winkia neuii]|uniref:Rossmann-like domain-containing protein n=1 Tax=Winkia neuii TaxID=33007 RepID=UPI0023A98EC8|nr:DUF364 domain-containing protein [Winkia neuii]WEB73486.1 DUF364 domain-containing protein [Winkia neuii]